MTISISMPKDNYWLPAGATARVPMLDWFMQVQQELQLLADNFKEVDISNKEGFYGANPYCNNSPLIPKGIKIIITETVKVNEHQISENDSKMLSTIPSNLRKYAEGRHFLTKYKKGDTVVCNGTASQLRMLQAVAEIITIKTGKSHSFTTNPCELRPKPRFSFIAVRILNNLIEEDLSRTKRSLNDSIFKEVFPGFADQDFVPSHEFETAIEDFAYRVIDLYESETANFFENVARLNCLNNYRFNLKDDYSVQIVTYETNREIELTNRVRALEYELGYYRNLAGEEEYPRGEGYLKYGY